MPYYKTTCDDCSKEIKVLFSDRAMGKSLVHSFSMRCNCGAAWEADGQGKLEDYYRNIVLEQEGTWTLELKEAKQLGKALLILKKVDDLTMDQIFSIKKNFPQSFYQGTKAEMEIISYYFQEQDIIHKIKAKKD